MPTIEGLRFSYSRFPLPPGRLPFRRWRWELWHGRTCLLVPRALDLPGPGHLC